MSDDKDNRSPSLHPVSGTYLITGGTRGIGRAITLEFARSGASVIVNYLRNETAATELVARCRQDSSQVSLCRADLSTPEGIERIAAMVVERGTLAGLIHCAAIAAHRPFVELTLRHLDWTLDLNVRAFFQLTQRVLPNLGPSASIVVISSAGATRAVPDYAAAGAAKGALEALARHLAAELAPRGIRVNIVAPGAVETDAWKAIPDGATKLAAAAARAPIRRLVTPDEVASAVVFLCSPGASGINGHTLVVDGGAAIVW